MRRYDLDWLRVIVFGLLIFYHITGLQHAGPSRQKAESIVHWQQLHICEQHAADSSQHSHFHGRYADTRQPHYRRCYIRRSCYAVYLSAEDTVAELGCDSAAGAEPHASAEHG